MANLVITAASVIPAAGTKKQPGVAGEVLNVGDAVCLNPTDKNRVYQFDAKDAVDIYRQVLVGLCLAPAAAAGQPVSYAYFDNDTIAVGSILEQGQFYMGGWTRGKICPVLDMAIFQINTTQITSNVATFTAAIAHPFAAGDVLTTANCGSIYNGSTQTVAASLSAVTFSVNITHANDGPNSVTGSAQLKGVMSNLIGVASSASNLQILKRNTNVSR